MGGRGGRGRRERGRARAGDDVARLASRPVFDAPARARLAAGAGEGPDWEALDALAREQLLGALWHRRFAGVPGVPPWFLARQRERDLAALVAGARVADDLQAVLAALADAGVEALALKGPVLIGELFGDDAVLPGADLDLLVRPEQVPDAVRGLAALGYRPAREPDPAYLRTLVEVEFAHPGGRTPLDCHHRLGHPRHFPGPEAFWWEGARTRDFRGRAVRVPGKEQSLLFAVLHLFKHSFRGLRHLAVFAAMVATWREAVDWEGVTQGARAFRADRALLVAVHLAEALFAVVPPPALAGALAGVRRGGRLLLARLEGEVLRPRASGGAVRLAVMGWQHGLLGTAALLGRWVVPPADEIRLRYDVPPGSRWLLWHYLANPVRLIARRGR